MCGIMAYIQSPIAEIRRGKKKRKKKEEQTTGWKYIWPAVLHRVAIKQLCGYVCTTLLFMWHIYCRCLTKDVVRWHVCVFNVKLASEYNIRFLETSAKTSVNVEEAFITLSRDIKTKIDRKAVSPRPYLSNRFFEVTPTFVLYCLIKDLIQWWNTRMQ